MTDSLHARIEQLASEIGGVNSARLRRLNVEVGRLERAMDEIAADAMEDERGKDHAFVLAFHKIYGVRH